MLSWGAVPRAIRARFLPPPNRRTYSSTEEYEEALGYWRGHIGRPLAFAMQKHRETPRHILYRVVPHNRGLVFADSERAEHIASIHEAIRASKTWGEFRRQMPADEFEEIMASAFDDQSEPRPDDGVAFNGDVIPGWVDGGYPPWLQREQDSILPQRVLATFAKSVRTSINGTYWHIPEESVLDVCNALRELGFTVECKQELPFH